ncbi:MAG: transcriptional regulator NrdR [Bacillota bacterium]|nr:transcriptional regulator NrdR [Bacillota bacterium]MDD3297565.1 transcriptional regulator NrdR [Bacillota bacterium]MDD3850186.1 transcriptional regulator NrdR [Bacillota bacterium]MDD4707270.1 transcriptional regulator NrdR [Bacillota bacterium]
MKCPFCGNLESKVVDSRPADEGFTIRRRRECSKCCRRFTTYEKLDRLPLMVVKKDGRRESFNREKVLNGIIKATEKRPVSVNRINDLVDEIEKKLYNIMEKEITSKTIGEIIMEKLKELDEVAYVRFASVYRQFKDINTFMEELSKLLDKESQESAEKTNDL